MSSGEIVTISENLTVRARGGEVVGDEIEIDSFCDLTLSERARRAASSSRASVGLMRSEMKVDWAWSHIPVRSRLTTAPVLSFS